MNESPFADQLAPVVHGLLELHRDKMMALLAAAVTDTTDDQIITDITTAWSHLGEALRLMQRVYFAAGLTEPLRRDDDQ